MYGSNVTFLILWTALLDVNALKIHYNYSSPEINSRTRLKTNSSVPSEYFSHYEKRNFNNSIREVDDQTNKFPGLQILPDCRVGTHKIVSHITAGITGLDIDCEELALFKHNDFTTMEFYLYKNTIKPSMGLKRSCLNLEFACQGVLLHQGNFLIINVALPNIRNMVVALVFKNGLVDFIKVKLLEMEKCNLPISVCRKMIFENLNDAIQRGDRTRIVGAVAAVSEFLNEEQITEGFERLFLIINQLYEELCLWCMHQTVSLLQSVMNDYIVVTKGKMNSYNCLEMSKHLLMISKSMYDFVKSSKEENRPAVIENINMIKTIFQNCMKLLKDNIYFDTNYDHFGLTRNEVDDLVLQNLDDMLMYYGHLLLLLSVYNNEDTSEINDFDIKFHILKSNTNDKNNSTVLSDGVSAGPAFINELMKEADMWAFYVYKFKKEIWQLPESDSVQLQTQILSMNLVNMKDKMKRRSSKEFKNPINMQLKFNEPYKAPIMNYMIQAPTNDSDNKTLDSEVLVFQVDMTNVSTLFVTISNMTDSLLFTWLRNTRPDIELMSNEKYTTELPLKEEHKFKLNTLRGYSNPMHYLGFYVKAKASIDNGTSSKNSTSNTRFTISIFSPQCLYWDGMDWITDKVEVGPTTSNSEIHCRAYHLSMFSSAVLPIPDPINPFLEILHPQLFEDNVFCIIVLLIFFIIYFVLTAWAFWEDKLDSLRGSIHILPDNYPGEDEVYLIKIYTGNIVGAGTSANVCIQIHGTLASSRVHRLYSVECTLLQRFSDDWFLMFCHTPLGDVQSIHLWHDNTGKHPDWYCKRVEVNEVRRDITWEITVERWFSLLMENQRVDYIINVGESYIWTNQARDNIELSLREEHLWASIFTRHPRSWCTRCQRLAKTMCFILSVMTISFLYFDLLEIDEERFLYFELTIRQIWIAIQCSIIQMIMTYAVSFCFKRTARHHTVDDPEDDTAHAKVPLKKRAIKKIVSLVTPKRPYKPAHVVLKKIKKSSESFVGWLVAGWTICILIYAFSSVIIIVYGLKLGLVKSLHWLMTVVFTILQSVIISQPIKILIINIFTYRFSQTYQKSLNTYDIVLDHYRQRNKDVLDKPESYVKVVRFIRETRTFTLYSPSGNTLDVQAFANQQQLNWQYSKFQTDANFCILLICASVLCIFALNSFVSPHNTRNVSNSYRKCIQDYLKTDTFDLETLKSILTGNLTEMVHFKKFYSGEPLDSDIKITKSTSERGWYGLYESKIINGGMRLRQHRVKATEKDHTVKLDKGHYDEFWTETKVMDAITPWRYRSLLSRLTLVDVDHSGYVLELTGGIKLWKHKLKSHLKKNWIDNRTDSLIVEFQMYTPNTDCMTMFTVMFKSTSMLFYRTSLSVLTVPMNSVFIWWATYVFTFLFMMFYVYLCVRLGNSVMEDLTRYGIAAFLRFWTLFETLLMVSVVLMVFALALRWSLMETAAQQYTEVMEREFSGMLIEVCWLHWFVLQLASVMLAMAILRTFRLYVHSASALIVSDMLAVTGGRFCVVALYFALLAIGAWTYSAGATVYGSDDYFNVFVFGKHFFDGHPVLAGLVSLFTVLFFKVAIIAIMIKYYGILETESV